MRSVSPFFAVVSGMVSVFDCPAAGKVAPARHPIRTTASKTDFMELDIVASRRWKNDVCECALVGHSPYLRSIIFLVVVNDLLSLPAAWMR